MTDTASQQGGEQQVQPDIMRYFNFLHLREPLQSVSAEFAQLAVYIANELPPGAERSVALRRLLEAKDAAVRAALDIVADIVADAEQASTGQVLGVLPVSTGGGCCRDKGGEDGHG